MNKKTPLAKVGKRVHKKKVMVSGGFDPLHKGHIRMIQEAKKLGDSLTVVINNDNWLIKKKGYFFLPQDERKEIISALTGVDEVYITKHPKNPSDMSVLEALKKIKPDIFAQGGDRKPNNMPSVEMIYCKNNNCTMVYNIGKGGKVQSSSWLTTNFINEIMDKSCPCKSGKSFQDCGLKNTPEHKKFLKNLLNN